MQSKGKEEYVEMNLNQFLEQENAHEISLSDIITTEEYKALCPTPDSCNKEDLKDLLYQFGMDNQLPVTEQNNTHRNWKGDVVTCLRWVGTKRKDAEWLKLMRG